MKKIFAIIFLIAPSLTLAHGGVSKNIGSTVVYLNQNPLSPLVGENVDFVFTITDQKTQIIPGLPVELTVTDTFFGDASRDKLVSTKNLTTDVNGNLELNYSFPNSDYFDIELNYKDPVTGQNDQTGFLVQPRQEENTMSKSIWLPLFAGLVIGIIVGIMIKQRIK